MSWVCLAASFVCSQRSRHWPACEWGRGTGAEGSTLGERPCLLRGPRDYRPRRIRCSLLLSAWSGSIIDDAVSKVSKAVWGSASMQWKFFIGACFLTGALLMPHAGRGPILAGMALGGLV